MADKQISALIQEIQILPDRLYLPQNDRLDIRRSLSNETDALAKDKIEISVLETGVGIESTQNLQITPSADTIKNHHSHIITELDILKSQIKTITVKLDYNLTVLKEKEEKNKVLTSILIAKTKEKKINRSRTEESLCSCTRGCVIV